MRLHPQPGKHAFEWRIADWDGSGRGKAPVVISPVVYFTREACQEAIEALPLGQRLGFKPIQSRTHGYNGQEHR